MKKFFKGCLLTTIAIIAVAIVSLVFYLKSPNKIEFLTEPIALEELKSDIYYGNKEIPEIIQNQTEGDILYQVLMVDDGMDKSVLYKAVYKTEKNIELENDLPLNKTELDELNEKIAFQKIDKGFNPCIIIPDNKKTPRGRKLKLFSVIDDIHLNLTQGGYSYYYNSTDKVGSLFEVIIYDSEKSILYFERQRYFAFQ